MDDHLFPQNNNHCFCPLGPRPSSVPSLRIGRRRERALLWLDPRLPSPLPSPPLSSFPDLFALLGGMFCSLLLLPPSDLAFPSLPGQLPCSLGPEHEEGGSTILALGPAVPSSLALERCSPGQVLTPTTFFVCFSTGLRTWREGLCLISRLVNAAQTPLPSWQTWSFRLC